MSTLLLSRRLPVAADRMATAIRIAAIGCLVLFAVTTPGFLSAPAIRSFLTTMSFVGCVAVGMSFITIGGSLMSFSLGVGLSATTIVFVAALPLGLWPAAGLAILFSCLLNGVQGLVVGYLRANPIIVTMASFALITGIATQITAGRGIYAFGTETAAFKGNLGPVPLPLAVFLGVVVTGQAILGHTRIGRQIILTGSNPRSVLAAGIEPWRPITWSFVLAGFFTAFAAILMAARYGSGDLQHGIGMEYHAISAVLVGGTAIHGGSGSILRTFFGTLIIAVFQAVLVLRGFSTELQHLALGVLVLLVIILQRK